MTGTTYACGGRPRASPRFPPPAAASPGHHAAAHVSAFQAHVDDPVGGLDDVQVVLDDDDRVALVHQAAEDFQQLGDVREVEAGRWLIEDVDGLAGAALAQL